MPSASHNQCLLLNHCQPLVRISGYLLLSEVLLLVLLQGLPINLKLTSLEQVLRFLLKSLNIHNSGTLTQVPLFMSLIMLIICLKVLLSLALIKFSLAMVKVCPSHLLALPIFLLLTHHTLLHTQESITCSCHYQESNFCQSVCKG